MPTEDVTFCPSGLNSDVCTSVVQAEGVGLAVGKEVVGRVGKHRADKMMGAAGVISEWCLFK